MSGQEDKKSVPPTKIFPSIKENFEMNQTFQKDIKTKLDIKTKFYMYGNNNKFPEI